MSNFFSFEDTNFVFSSLNHYRDVFTLRFTGNLNNKLSLQIYSEIFKSHDNYDNYTEYLVISSLHTTLPKD